ncbi:MAG: hypothetical protein QM755_01450 [Luteolibacter sp.]
MTPAERFAAAFVRPFSGKPEIVARAEEELFKGSITANPVEFATAADRLDKMDRRPSWWKWLAMAGWWVALAIWLAEAAAIGRGPSQIFRSIRFLDGGNSSLGIASATGIFAYGPTTPASRFKAGISERDRNWIAPDDNQQALAAKARWDEQPDNPERLVDYLEMNRAARLDLPADLAATAERVDPGNGWPLFLIGCDRIKDATQEVPIRGKSGFTLEIRNRARFDEGLALLHQAAGQPAFRTYRRQLTKERMALLSGKGDALEQIERLTLYFGSSSPFSLSIKIFLMGAETAAAEGRSDIVKQMASDWYSLARLLASDITTDQEALALVAWIKAGAKLRDVCRSVQAESEAAKIESVLTSPALAQVQLGSRPDSEWITGHGSNIASVAVPYRVATPPPSKLFEAQRMILHTIFDRAQMWNIMTGFIGLAGVIRLVRLRYSRPLKTVADRFGLLADARDHLWIGGIGIILPFAVLVIIRFTSWGGVDYSPQSPIGNGLLMQSFASLLLIAAMFMETARWRMEKKIGPLLGRVSTSRAMAFILPSLCLMAMLAIGIRMQEGGWETAHQEQAIHLLAVAALIRFGVLAIGPKATSVFRIATLEVMLSCCLAASLLAAIFIPYFIHSEHHWVSVDPWFDRNPEYLGLGKFHHDEVERMQRLLIEALQPK